MVVNRQTRRVATVRAATWRPRQGNAGSPESGQGETADRGGDKQLAPEATGQSGQTPGSGSQTVNTPQGQELTQQGAPPQNPDAQPDAGAQPQDPQVQPAQPQPNDSRGGTSSGPPEGGGLPGDGVPTGADGTRPNCAEADEANLEYARKATDLVLERLKDQQQDPDPELLKSLGWTKEEMQQFIARWEELKRAAREEGPAGPGRPGRCAPQPRFARHELLDVAAATRTTIKPVANRESGSLSRPPAEFLEQFNAYKKGGARGPSDGGAHRP